MAAARPAGPASGYRARNSTADRALEILLLFDDDHLHVSATEVAGHLGVARSTAYRYLESLTANSFLEDAGGRYRLGPRVLDLARIARRGVGLSDLARPILRSLVERTNAPALLTRRTGTAVVCVEREEAASVLRLSYERGQVLPINAGAAALSLLAWAPEEELVQLLERPLERFTSSTIVDTSELRHRLTDIRRDGHAVSSGELDEDVLGVAAPIFEGDRVIAAVSIATLSHRVSKARLGELVAHVREAAAQLTQQVELADTR